MPNLDGKRTKEIIAEENGESHEQVRRYIRLTELIPELLDMVDIRKIAFRPAVEISYLSKDNQYVLYDEIKNKEIINDSIVATERETSEMDIKFTFSVNNTRSTILIDDYLKYNIQDKWDSGYNDLINKINEISQEDYDKIISSYQNTVENK